MKIAVDAMGGDHAPLSNIEGVVLAAREGIAEILLVGSEDILKEHLQKYSDIKKLPITIIHASQVIEMHETPVQACRLKKDASMNVCARLVAEGKADAWVSAGNSGAAMTSALLNLKRIQDVSRPAIASILPTITGKSLVLDVGANVDCRPEHLLEFAIMGSVYMQHVYNISKPKVAILSIGEEESKGNELSLEAFKLLQKSNLNFIGNIEGRDIPRGVADVVVCDGFVGNIVLKLSEGLAFTVLSLLKQEILKNIIRIGGYLLLRGAFHSIKKKIDFNEYGGAPLLGTNGGTIICHGVSNAKAIKNAISVAAEFIRTNVNAEIEKEISEEESRILEQP